MRLRAAFPLVLSLLVSACATAPPGPQRAGGYASVELSGVPFYPQQRFQCGPAALATVLNWSGLTTTPERLADAVFIPEREGSLQPELRAQARRHGRLAYRIAPTADALLTELEAGHPTLVLQNLGLSWAPRWHYAVLVGYHAPTREVVLRSGKDKRHRLPLATFLRTWARGGNWGLLVLPSGRLPRSAEPAAYLAAAFELERAGHADAARSAYRAAIARWPRLAEFRLALANAEYAREDVSAAAAVLKLALADGIREGAVYNNLALLLAELGRWGRAEAAARQAVSAGGERRAEFEKTLRSILAARSALAGAGSANQ